MSCLNNQKGVALMMVLVISVIVLAVMSTMLYMLTTGTKVSGIEKRYSTSLEAATGGKTVVMDFIRAGEIPELAKEVNMQLGITNSCLDQKLNLSTEYWENTCDSSLVIDPSDAATYDVRFDLESYTVYAKIVNTVEGNSARGSTGLSTRGVTHSKSTGGSRVQHIPYYYAVEMEARDQNNPAELSRVSILYEY